MSYPHKVRLTAPPKLSRLERESTIADYERRIAHWESVGAGNCDYTMHLRTLAECERLYILDDELTDDSAFAAEFRNWLTASKGPGPR